MSESAPGELPRSYTLDLLGVLLKDWQMPSGMSLVLLLDSALVTGRLAPQDAQSLYVQVDTRLRNACVEHGVEYGAIALHDVELLPLGGSIPSMRLPLLWVFPSEVRAFGFGNEFRKP